MSTSVVLIGFQDQGNLGLGYLASSLGKAGYEVRILDFRDERERLLREIQDAQPAVVGFSIIFQYYLPGFAALAEFLRQEGVDCHFTAGGHYPSLCHDETLEAFPALDSVVRFEGEHTLTELVGRIEAEQDWSDLHGLAFRRGGRLVENPLRPAIPDLDSLPYPQRYFQPEQVLGKKADPILASRGCARTCSFCSIHMFYRAAPGKIVRVRKPPEIVREMRHLHEERGVQVFLFQDDDFPLWGKAGRRWVDELVAELHAQQLVGKVIWKISCRVDYIEPELFAKLRDAGLYLVYMGLESGNDEGLDVLHKQVTVERNEEGVAILKRLGLMFEYGFMLFDPSTTFESIRGNIGFLRRIVGDGSAGAVYCRMLPYGGTPIRDQLAKEGRLKGDIVRPDYDFLDPRLDGYFHTLDKAVGPWIHGDGVSHQLNWAWNELAILERLFPPMDGVEEYREFLRALTRESNEVLFHAVEESSLLWERDGEAPLSQYELEHDARRILGKLLPERNNFVAQNQATLLEELRAERMSGPIMAPQIF